jgi:hypothetical protein
MDPHIRIMDQDQLPTWWPEYKSPAGRVGRPEGSPEDELFQRSADFRYTNPSASLQSAATRCNIY